MGKKLQKAHSYLIQVFTCIYIDTQASGILFLFIPSLPVGVPFWTAQNTRVYGKEVIKSARLAASSVFTC